MKKLFVLLLLAAAQFSFAKGGQSMDTTLECRAWFLDTPRTVSFDPWEIRSEWGTFRWTVPPMGDNRLHAVKEDTHIVLDRFTGTISVVQSSIVKFSGSCKKIEPPAMQF